MQILVIVESPAKCKKIESYLGPGYKVMASFGHLRTINGLDAIDINNNFATKYTIIEESLKLKQIEKIRAELTKSSDVLLATDDDREGEAIAWHICDLFGLSVEKTKRIIFHEITETAIQSAVAHPKTVNMRLVNAQQARQILDLLVGFTISPMLWHSIAKNHETSLSAGRCQTPALKLVYDNYLEIKDSPGNFVYNTTGYFTNLNLLFDLNKQFTNKEEVNIFLEKCKVFQFLGSKTAPKKTIRKQPEPLTTSSLQQLVSNELHYSPKETMKYAQQLYEHGHITYMRTDSKKYCQDFIDSAKLHIQNTYGDKFVSSNIDNLSINDNKIPIKKTNKTVSEKKNIPAPQEAHEAVRPVNINKHILSKEEQTELDSKAIRLYEIIHKKALESCMSVAQYTTITAKITAPLESEFIYKAEEAIFLGWQIVEQTNKKSTNKDVSVYQYISNLKQNIELKPKKIESKFALVELKSHYSEARLVQLLEEKGIGRPSTFASLIDKIQERKYVEKQNIAGKEIESTDYILSENTIQETTSKKVFGNEKNKLVILPLGIIVIEFLLSNFSTFFNYDYTKEMEDKLDHIASGEKEWVTLCNDCNNDLIDITKDLQDLKKFSIEIDGDHTLIIGKHGPVVKYTDPKNKKRVSFIPVKKNLDLEKLKHIPEISLEDVIETSVPDKASIGKYKGKDLFIKKGKYGIYAQWGSETRTLKGEFESANMANIDYMDVIRFLDKDLLDTAKPFGLVREINDKLSIRSSKHGDYILYKKPRAKKPEFLKLSNFNADYKKCDKDLLLNWIKQTYNI